jgi:hypothetical protein
LKSAAASRYVTAEASIDASAFLLPPIQVRGPRRRHGLLALVQVATLEVVADDEGDEATPAIPGAVCRLDVGLKARPVSGVLRTLSEEELAEYRRPFANPGEDRRPTLSWARENPLDGEPADVTEIMNSYSEWLSRSSVP